MEGFEEGATHEVLGPDHVCRFNQKHATETRKAKASESGGDLQGAILVPGMPLATQQQFYEVLYSDGSTHLQVEGEASGWLLTVWMVVVLMHALRASWRNQYTYLTRMWTWMSG